VPTTDKVWNGNMDYLKMPNETTIHDPDITSTRQHNMKIGQQAFYTGPKDDDDDDIMSPPLRVLENLLALSMWDLS